MPALEVVRDANLSPKLKKPLHKESRQKYKKGPPLLGFFSFCFFWKREGIYIRDVFVILEESHEDRDTRNGAVEE